MKHIALYATLALVQIGFLAPLRAHDKPPSPPSVVLTGNSDQKVEMLFSVPSAGHGNSEKDSCKELSFTVSASEPTGLLSPVEMPVELEAGGFQKVEIDLGLLGVETVDVIIELTNIRKKGLCFLRPSLLRFTGPDGETSIGNPLVIHAAVLYHCYNSHTQVGCNPD